MIFKKILFPIFSLIGILIFFSCTHREKKLKNSEYNNLINKGLTTFDKQDFDSSFFYFYKSKDVCKNEDIEKKTFSLYYLAEIQLKQCDFAESEATTTQILRINPQYKYINSVYNLLGLSYLEQYNYDSAIKYFNLATKNSINQKDKFVYTNNIGYALLEANKYKNAQKLLYKIITNDSLINDKLNYSKVLDNLGYAYFKLNNPIAINYLNKSLQIRDSIKNEFELIPSFIHLSEYYQNSNTYLAKDYALKAYQAATKINSPDDRILALKFLISNSNTNEIKALALKQMSISDSINKIRQNSKTQFAKIKYDSTIAIKESEKQKTEKQLYIALSIFITILSIVVLFSLRSRNKRKLLKATYETETRISKKLHDELANDVFNAMTFADTQNLEEPNKKETLLENLDKIYTQARNISKENNQIDTSENFEQILKEMMSSYSCNQTNVIINNINSIEWNKLKKETKIIIYRTLQELMVNMKKHSQCSLVLVGFENKKSTLKINYSDNGIGCENVLKFKKGLQNAENRISTIKGSIIFESESNKGFKAKITIPK